MQPHQQRVVDEKTELDGKLEKLQAFMFTSIHDGLPEDEKTRLKEQSVHMASYSRVLGERIAAF